MSKQDSKIAPSLDELERLAREPSVENWRYLLQGLTDHFLANAKQHTIQYGDAFSDIICRILEVVTIEARTELSERVAELDQFPGRIVRQLAGDEHQVARPVLEKSPVLTDSDLIRIAYQMMQDHQISISRRETLGRRLTEALLSTGDLEVIREMAGNPGANFSESTYRKVAERAKQDQVLQEKLVDRDDLSPAIAIQLTPFLSDKLKQKLKKEDASLAKGLLDSLSELTAEEAKKSKSPAALEVDTGVDELIAKIRDGDADISAVVARLADHGKLSEVRRLLAAMSGLPEKNVKSALSNLNGMPIAIICKSLELSQDAFEAVSHLRCENLRLPNTEIVTQVDQYTGLNETEAKKTIASIKAKETKAA